MFQRWYYYKWLIFSGLTVVGAGVALVIFAVSNGYDADVVDNRPVRPSIPTDTAQNAASQASTAVIEESSIAPLYTVTKIYDGDTIDAFRDGETITVRLACIDSPESAQAPNSHCLTSLRPRGSVGISLLLSSPR